MEPIQMKPRYAVVLSYAGHCNWQGKDKDYAICLARQIVSDIALDESEDADTQNWMVLFVYGKPGAIRGGDPGPLLTKGAAEKEYNKKVKEKSVAHHYTPHPGLDFAPFARHFKVPLEFPDTVNPAAGKDLASSDAISLGATESRATARYAGCPVTNMTLDRFWQYAESSQFGTEEKADGERCLIAAQQQGQTAYNRDGVASSDFPEVAKALLRLSDLPFLVDGEKMVNTKQKGHYILFDLLEWQGQDIRAWPYQRRNRTLKQAMYETGLIKEIRSTPTIQQAYENSTVDGLALLTPAAGREDIQQIVAVIQQQGGEGMVVRDLTAPYLAANSAFKYKFTADIDVVVIGINPGDHGGSLKLGLRRPIGKYGSIDNAIVSAGSVRAGLSEEDMNWFADQLAQGKQVVIRVKYRLKRTIGIILVEPDTNIKWVRTDKSAWECTTDQWSIEKAEFVDSADALRNITFETTAHSTLSDQTLSQ